MTRPEPMPVLSAKLSKPPFRGFALLCLLAACAARAGRQEEKDVVTYHPSSQVRVIPDLVYATYGRQRLLLDLYLPLRQAEKFPAVVVVRGGGWLASDRKRFAHVSAALAERGVVAASIEYRTAGEALFPGAIQDVKAAIRWLRAHAARYG